MRALSALSVLFPFGAGVWQQIAKLVPSNSESEEWFGYPQVALDKDIALIGASRDDPSGSVAVFEQLGNVWVETATLLPDAGNPSFGFGNSVAVSDEWALVGATLDNEKGPAAGAVFVFPRSADGWPSFNGLGSEPSKLTASDPDPYALFGSDIDVENRRAIISARNDLGVGAAYVFERRADGWTEMAKLVPYDGEISDGFGWSVALWQDTVVVGSPRSDAFVGNEGAAYVFQEDDSGWHLAAKLVSPQPYVMSGFGGFVAIHGNTIVATQPSSSAGSAYVFERQGTAWQWTATLNPPMPLYGLSFGTSTAMNGNVILVGAHKPGIPQPGEVYVFERFGTTWMQTATLAADDGHAYNGFGWSVALFDRTVLVGSPWNSVNGNASGSAYVFESLARVLTRP